MVERTPEEQQYWDDYDKTISEITAQNERYALEAPEREAKQRVWEAEHLARRRRHKLYMLAYCVSQCGLEYDRAFTNWAYGEYLKGYEF